MRQKYGCKKKEKKEKQSHFPSPAPHTTHERDPKIFKFFLFEQQLRPVMGTARSQTWKWKLNLNRPEATKAESLCDLAMPRNSPHISCKQNQCQRAGPLTPTRSESDSLLQCELSNRCDYTDCNWPATPCSCSNPHMETPWDTTACPLQVYQTHVEWLDELLRNLKDVFFLG